MVGRVHLVAGEGLEKATKQQKRSEQDEKIGSGFGSGFCFCFLSSFTSARFDDQFDLGGRG